MILISRHLATVEWLKSKGVAVDKHQSHFDTKNVKTGDVIIGNLPIQMVAEVCIKGGEYHHIEIDLPKDLRGKELTVDNLNQLGAKIVQYNASKIQDAKVLKVNKESKKEISNVQDYKIGFWEAYEKKDGIIAAVIVVILLIAFGLEYYFSRDFFDKLDFLGITFGFLPLVPFFILYRSQVLKKYVEDLPNYLKVEFTYKDEVKITAKYCPISGIENIREQSQSIGRAILGGKNLKIAPMISGVVIKVVSSDKSKTINDGKPFELHSVKIKLTEPLSKQDSKYDLKDDHTVVWNNPFEMEDIMVSGENIEGAVKIEELALSVKNN